MDLPKTKSGALAGAPVYEHLAKNKIPGILLACNFRYIPGISLGVFKALKKTNTIAIAELAKSECDVNKGYTGMTPQMFVEQITEVAQEVDWPWYILHADHITVKEDNTEAIDSAKALIKAHLEEGTGSFAIDCSYHFNTEADEVSEQLKRNIELTAELADFLNKHASFDFGLEVEVGEVGKKDQEGFVVTTVEEADYYINALTEKGFSPNFLAIANGSTHGNIFDEKGKKIDQITIDIPRTIEIGKAISKYGVRVAQHGITGTPLTFIEQHFPKLEIGKGNVGTNWQNIFYDALEKHEPEMYTKAREWVLEEFGSQPKNQGKPEAIIFGNNAKYAFREFYDEFRTIGKEALKAMEKNAYDSAMEFLKAFGSRDLVKHFKD